MRTFCGLLLLSALNVFGAEITPIHKLPQADRQARMEQDARDVLSHRDGLRDVIDFMESHPELSAGAVDKGRLMRREEKEALWNAWQRLLDYMLALDSIEKYHANSYRLRGEPREDSFMIGYAAMVAKYRAALEFIECAERNPALHTVLNDAVPELGLPAGTYSKMKFKYLNAGMGTEFAAREVIFKTFKANRRTDLRAVIRTDARQVWNAGKGRGELLTLKNAWTIVQDATQSAWLPVQTGVSEWMGDTKVRRAGQCLISPEQIRDLQPQLMPGDILLERREWYLSNIGLPGFWSHAALYLGTVDERRKFFDDAETREWVKQQGESSGDFETSLRSRYPIAYEQSLAPREHGHPVRVIEAISEGVSFTSLEHSADCDSLAVLRPRLARRDKARALFRAFHYAGRPYDFKFDFATDAELVCTELVYKAYEPSAGFAGLELPLIEMLGRKVMPANELARQFDAQHGTPEQQCDLVAFLDGHERRAKAVEASEAAFRQSWKRPKWHVFVQRKE
jgi:hypothetical protein